MKENPATTIHQQLHVGQCYNPVDTRYVAGHNKGGQLDAAAADILQLTSSPHHFSMQQVLAAWKVTCLVNLLLLASMLIACFSTTFACTGHMHGRVALVHGVCIDSTSVLPVKVHMAASSEYRTIP